MTSSATAGLATQEGKTITFTVTPSGIVAAQTVLNLNMIGSALGAITATTSAADFTTASSLIFAAGDTAAKTVTVTVVNDGATEGLEAYKAQLLDSSYNEKAAIQGTVTDATPTVTLTAGATSVNEGAALTFTATSDMAAPAGGLVVPVTFGGTATSADYTTSATSITIAAGATTGTLTVNAIADNATEGAETVTAALGNVNGATTVTTAVSATINDTSLALAANAFSLSGAATANEGTSVVYTITRGAAATVATTVPYTITGTAVAGSDYTAQTGTASFAIGATTATITLPITADLLTEGSETVIVTLGTPSVATDVITTGAGVVTTTIADTSTTAVVSAFALTASANTTTNGVDNVTGTAYNAITAFIDMSAGTSAGTASTWNLTDTIAPAASANAAINLTVLNAGTLNSGAASLAGYTATNIATLNLKVIDSATATSDATTFDVGALTGLTTVNVDSSSTIGITNNDNVTVSSIPAVAKLSVNNNGRYTNVTGDWVTAATSGSADTVNLVLGGRNGTVTVGTTATGFETAAITATTGARADSLVAGTTLKAVTVSGTDFRVDTAIATNATTFSFDATNASGVVNVALTPVSTFSAKGGSGTSDVVQLLASGSMPTISGFETVVAGAATAFDLTNISGNTALGVAVGAGSASFTNAAATQNTLVFSGNYNTARATDLSGANSLSTSGDVGYGLKTATGAADALTVAFNNGGTAAVGTTAAPATYTVGGTLTANAIENITLTEADWKGITFTTGISDNLTNTTASVLNFKASGASNLALGTVTVTSGVATGTDTFDFSGQTGTLSAVLVDSTKNILWTGGTGAETITVASLPAATNTAAYNMGNAANVVTISSTASSTVNAGTTSITGGTADDTFVLAGNGSIGATATTAGTELTATGFGVYNINGGTSTTSSANVLKVTQTAVNAVDYVTMSNIQKVVFQGSGNQTVNATVATGYGTSSTETVGVTFVGATDVLNIISATNGTASIANYTKLGTGTIGLQGNTGNETLTGSTTAAASIDGKGGSDTLILGTHTGVDTIASSTAGQLYTISGWRGASTNTVSDLLTLSLGTVVEGASALNGVTKVYTQGTVAGTTDGTIAFTAQAITTAGAFTAAGGANIFDLNVPAQTFATATAAFAAIATSGADALTLTASTNAQKMFLEYNGTDGNIHFAAATVTGAAAGITATTTTYTNATDFVVIVGAASHALALTGLSLVA